MHPRRAELAALPDPADRSLPWWNGQPAYTAWWQKLMELRDQHLILEHVGRLDVAYAHAIPVTAALDTLAAQSPLIEVAAGAGYWARLLRDRDVDIVTTEPHPNDPWTNAGLAPWTTVLTRSVEVVLDFPDRAAFVCMPPRPTSEHGFMQMLLERGPQTTLVLVSDGEGLAGPDLMYEILRRDWSQSESLDLPNWPGRCHKLMVWHRRY